MTTFKKALPLTLAVALLGGCGDAGEDDSSAVAEEAAEAVEQVAEGAERESERFATEVRSALDELTGTIGDLEGRYGEATDEAARRWEDARPEVEAARRRLEAALTEMRDTAGERSDEIQAEVTSAVGSLTEEVERARLITIEDRQEFLEASRMRLDEIENDLTSLRSASEDLTAAAREDASLAIEEFRARIQELERRTNMDAGDVDFSEVREDIAEEIASLSADVQRMWFDVRTPSE